MKLQTNYTVTVSLEEAGKLLSKGVEKKTGKKVVNVAINSEQDGPDKLKSFFAFTLQSDETDMDKEGA
jgi:hypothetical protein